MQTLFTVESPGVRLTWSGPAATRPGAAPFALIPGAEIPRLVSSSDGVWFEEETSYLVLLQSLDGAPVALVHRDPVVVGALASADGQRVLHGRVRLGSQAGRIRFAIRHGSTVSFEFGTDVLPSKLTADEVTKMRAEIEATAAGLSVTPLRPTVIGVSLGDARPSPPVWLAALRQAADGLADAVREIERRPVLDVTRIAEERRAGQIRRPTAETRLAARRRGIHVPTLPARPAALTADTPAHRWLAARLDAVAGRLATLAREEGARRTSRRRDAVVDEVRDLQDRLEATRSRPVFGSVGARAPAAPPLVLRRAAAYAAAFDALRRLDQGLDLRAGSLDVSTQDLAVLYETWAALAVVRVVAGALGVPAPARPFGVDTVGADVRLRRGRAHAVRLTARGVEVEVVYTPRFPAPPALLAQRPDLLLTVRRGSDVRRVVLDAKYRRDDSAGYRRRHGAAGPPEDALGTLHRYRDAIVQGPPVAQAAALFPGTPDDAFYRSRLWTSLDALGVGAVPLRPGAEGALAAFIAGLVG
ncbi:DUF2357 domain-containing protein [Rubrivirga sp.]|uniref:DUF2357 domain-containing protein n=1 Tax=Rubrivirga sp. TaxID=1885344 RepID=UPI003B52F3C1